MLGYHAMFSSSVRIPSVEEGEMTCELPWAHVELPEAHEQGAVHARASASGKPSEKHATGADTLDMSLSPPCAAPHVGQNSTGDTEVDVLLANQLGREAILRVEEDKRQDKASRQTLGGHTPALASCTLSNQSYIISCIVVLQASSKSY